MFNMCLTMIELSTISIVDFASLPTHVLIITGQIFAILNPISVLPTFLTLTDDMRSAERHKIVLNSCVAVFLICIILAIAGSYILNFFQVSISGLQVGGGVLLMTIAIEMLGGLPRTKSLESQNEIAIVPLATPLLVGPGTMTTIIVLSASYPLLPILISILIVSSVTYLLLRYCDLLIAVIGKNGTRALGRFMTIIIAAFAAQLIYSGVSDWLRSWELIE